MDSSETQFIQIPEQADELVSMVISPDKTHLALSHTSLADPYPVITIYQI